VRTAARGAGLAAVLTQTRPLALAGKNALGLGPNATALALGAVIVATYYFSSYATKTWVMANRQETDAPKYFRDIQVTPKDDRQ
jgi:hypothetical protein